MPYDEALAERVADCLPTHATSRKMFGGMAYMIGGNMAVGVVADNLMVRVGPQAYDDALTHPHTTEMDFTGRPMRGMIYVTPDGVADEEDLAEWVARGVHFASSLPPKG